MRINLLQLEQRIRELESLADQVSVLAEKLTKDRHAQPELSTKGQAWFRGARELLAQQKSSGLGEFEACYIRYSQKANFKGERSSFDIGTYINRCTGKGEAVPSNDHYNRFMSEFQHARSLACAAVEEIKSRELPVVTGLSLTLSSDEFEKARELLEQSENDDAIIRAAGVIARVALERHLLTVAESHEVAVPPSRGKKPEASDAINALKRADYITAVQKSELECLFTVANQCAHPKEHVTPDGVARLIQRGRDLASVILQLGPPGSLSLTNCCVRNKKPRSNEQGF
jgi:hypothetical protein